MAGSLMARLRARLEEMQNEMQPEAGFDRRAYGYEDDQDDATFEEVDVEDESPWRRPASGAPPPGADSVATADTPRTPRGQMGRAAEVVPPRAAHRPPRPAAARPADSESPWARGGQPGGGVGRDSPPPPSREAPMPGRVPGSPIVGGRAGPYGLDRASARAATRLQRFRRRLRHPDSLRELFLLREVIDRPIALRRPRSRR